MQDLESEIGTFVATQLMGEENDSLPPDAQLLNLIDSFSLMQLVYHLEETYDLTFEMDELNDDNFHNVEAVASLVRRKKS